jgi:MFS family permease
MSNRRWLVLGLVFLGILVSYVDRGNLSIAAESIMRDLALKPEAMGLMLSAFFWTYAVCQIPAGLLIDRFGVRNVYAIAFAIWSLASASIALGHSQSDILLSRLVLGFAESVGPLASLAFIRANFAPRESGLPVGIYIGGQTLGPACGALLGTSLLASFGWRAMFAVTGLGALLWVPAWLAFAPASKIESAGSTGPWPWRIILRSPSVWAMSACVFFFSYYWYFLLTWMPAYMTSARGFSILDMGRILFVPLASMAVTNALFGRLADLLIKKTQSLFWVRVWFAAFGLLGASSLILLNVITRKEAVLPILLVSICSFGIVSSNYWTIAQNVVPPGKAGRAIGMLNTMSQLGGAAAPYITGITIGPHKHFSFSILIAGFCPIAAFALLMLAGPGLDKLRNALTESLPLEF